MQHDNNSHHSFIAVIGQGWFIDLRFYQGDTITSPCFYLMSTDSVSTHRTKYTNVHD